MKFNPSEENSKKKNLKSSLKIIHFKNIPNYDFGEGLLHEFNLATLTKI